MKAMTNKGAYHTVIGRNGMIKYEGSDYIIVHVSDPKSPTYWREESWQKKDCFLFPEYIEGFQLKVDYMMEHGLIQAEYDRVVAAARVKRDKAEDELSKKMFKELEEHKKNAI